MQQDPWPVLHRLTNVVSGLVVSGPAQSKQNPTLNPNGSGGNPIVETVGDHSSRVRHMSPPPQTSFVLETMQKIERIVNRRWRAFAAEGAVQILTEDDPRRPGVLRDRRIPLNKFRFEPENILSDSDTDSEMDENRWRDAYIWNAEGHNYDENDVEYSMDDDHNRLLILAGNFRDTNVFIKPVYTQAYGILISVDRHDYLVSARFSVYEGESDNLDRYPGVGEYAVNYQMRPTGTPLTDAELERRVVNAVKRVLQIR